MTFIVGINLSDRVLLSADTRLTFRENKTENFFDSFLKIKPLSQEIAVAVAGDPRLASFIIKGLILSKIMLALTVVSVVLALLQLVSIFLQNSGL